jgi:long-chain acyl-CoA synthetase
MLPNLITLPASLFGVWYGNNTATLINPLYTRNEVLKQCIDAQVETIIIGRVFYKTLRPIINKTKIKHIIIVDIGDMLKTIKRIYINTVITVKSKLYKIDKVDGVSYINLNKILSSNIDIDKSINLDNQLALLQYTGGSSGGLKGARIKHENIISNIKQLEKWLPKEIDNKSYILTALPLHHMFALTINCLLFISIKACSILILNPRDTNQLISPLRKYRVNVITGVSTLFKMIMRHKEFKRIDWSRLDLTVSGGMPLDENVSKKWQHVVGKPIIQGYGLSECSPVVSVENFKTNKYTGSVGKPLIHTKVKIIDEKLNNRAIGEVGEICIKGPQVMDSYWNKENLNGIVFTEDGYFRSGDIGYISNKGLIYIVGRTKELIIVSGFNVYPRDVEFILNKHPEVEKSICLGIKNKISGEVVKAYIKRELGSTLEKKSLLSYCKANMVHYKIPKKIEWVQDLPKRTKWEFK